MLVLVLLLLLLRGCLFLGRGPFLHAGGGRRRRLAAPGGVDARRNARGRRGPWLVLLLLLLRQFLLPLGVHGQEQGREFQGGVHLAVALVARGVPDAISADVVACTSAVASAHAAWVVASTKEQDRPWLPRDGRDHGGGGRGRVDHGGGAQNVPLVLFVLLPLEELQLLPEQGVAKAGEVAAPRRNVLVDAEDGEVPGRREGQQ